VKSEEFPSGVPSGEGMYTLAFSLKRGRQLRVCMSSAEAELTKMKIMKFAIKREQSQACLSFAERERTRCETSKNEKMKNEKMWFLFIVISRYLFF
jgi:hypothetical protein